ncbi:hypothetical protein KQX54_005390 [Cotesia glomerata]|uniref:Uncharacterized protein n=1 Tax=Cotesia glomerata TaxID=32391 RepID=A0AAV7I2H5_COTGL|nr:hypothetical protein KQX54_005390 [Cotesia glomerata]
MTVGVDNAHNHNHYHNVMVMWRERGIFPTSRLGMRTRLCRTRLGTEDLDVDLDRGGSTPVMLTLIIGISTRYDKVLDAYALVGNLRRISPMARSRRSEYKIPPYSSIVRV